ncbi:WYL domain-containing protein [Streptomyces sp. XM4193]|uniref:helix-turn-helix transcriptional regulator n=1 Tax=Streptomyces sp. XM4193 TaxID=2929782 RepID=UPI001FFB6B64|nr:WYL domain-containing protein [Streptomyces sp. XM4193]MCK1796271.1 WYL domain-containing protein [Streptomyces sp. XM4193]
MRASRLIKMVLLLQTRRHLTAAELAAELEVSERTVARDVAALSEAGVPVYADRGRLGGYRLVGGYRTRLTGMGREEAEALFLSGVPSALRDLGLADAASAAALKVSAALNPELRDARTNMAQRFHLDAPGWWREPQAPELLPTLAEAVWDDRRVTVRYRRRPPEPGTPEAGTPEAGGAGTPEAGTQRAGTPEAGKEVVRELEPYGLVLKAGVWYLAARVPTAAVRIYRIDRIGGVTVGQTVFDRDEEFDLPAFWAEQSAAFARSVLRESVTLRLSEAGAARLPHVHGDRTAVAEALAAAGPAEGGRLTVTLPVETMDVAYGQLLALGPDAEVLAPPRMRERMARAARATARLYECG